MIILTCNKPFSCFEL